MTTHKKKKYQKYSITNETVYDYALDDAECDETGQSPKSLIPDPNEPGMFILECEVVRVKDRVFGLGLIICGPNVDRGDKGREEGKGREGEGTWFFASGRVVVLQLVSYRVIFARVVLLAR